MLPNRTALYLGTVAAFVAGLAPVVADLDWQSTTGVLVGIGAIATYVNVFVLGQQKHEEREFWQDRVPSEQPPV